jgi:ribosomal protein S18 acetylase RimI-like enzyme
MEIVKVDKSNLENHPGVICFINKKNPAHPIKKEWLQKRFSEGFQIKLIYSSDPKELVGFIEYVPGEFAWRAVSAKEYMFIHCIWIYPNKNKNRGFGSHLIEECINEAKKNNFNGVATVTGKNAFMAGSSLFLKNGFKKISDDGKGNDLLALNFKNSNPPVINDWKSKLQTFNGLQIVYSKQCPWVARMVEEIQNTPELEKTGLQISELKTPEEAQNAPSMYATFNLIYNGKLLADRYISMTRFKNILKKEKLI